ncbi:MAG: alpha-L-fucosidase [Acidobacteria bacterium]|nr:alpha-L-fucosidase [Acidobacteriota bacterium]
MGDRSKQWNLSRRALLRAVGAGTAAAFSSESLSSSPAPAHQQPADDHPSCWDEVNDVDAARARQWERRMAWFNEAKFGMFIHWGPCSLASVEISWPIMRPARKWHITQEEYVNLYKRFNPVKYDPDAWVELARQAGQRYMVLVTKHHDGFCMFDSTFTDYKITNSPYKKDIVRLLGDACQRHGMPLGYYYSPPDMHHPDYRDTTKLVKENWEGEPTRHQWPNYLQYMQLQVRELICRYPTPFVLWFDGLGHQEKYDGYHVVRMIRELSPATLVNNRIGVPGDFGTPEQVVPRSIPVKGAAIQGIGRSQQKELPTGLPNQEELLHWETCMTINNTWAYNKNDRSFKSTEYLIQTLVDAASKGGNFLLNVGPTPEGTIQPEFQERLRGIGRWMKNNGDSIYGTTFGPLQNLPYGRTTAKGDMVYLHVFDWPAGQKLMVPDLNARVLDVQMLDGGKRLEFIPNASGLTIKVPARAQDQADTVLAIKTG